MTINEILERKELDEKAETPHYKSVPPIDDKDIPPMTSEDYTGIPD